ncbi:hypothetical protein HY251_10855 [bacterium]|nr:hypothetical protein [bacterium]
MDGTVVSIQIARTAHGPMETVPEARALEGKGLEGDRYFKRDGKFSGKVGPGREVTFIAIEAIEALAREHGIELEPRDSRRNVTTRGVSLNDLVGREFLAGDVRLRGIRLCEPCAHLSALTGKELLRGLAGRGGLTAEVLASGRALESIPSPTS